MFWFRFLRLLGSIAWEGIYNAACLVVFLIPGRFLPGQRAVVRERVRKLMSQPVSPMMRKNLWVFVSSLALVLSAAAGTGCRSAHCGGTFADKIDEFAWSAKTLASQKGELDGLQRDVVNFIDPEWGELEETFRLFGW